MYTQRPFTSQLISKIYFLTFASYIEKLPETTIKFCCLLYPKINTCVIRHRKKIFLFPVTRPTVQKRADRNQFYSLFEKIKYFFHDRLPVLYCIYQKSNFLEKFWDMIASKYINNSAEQHLRCFYFSSDVTQRSTWWSRHRGLTLENTKTWLIPGIVLWSACFFPYRHVGIIWSRRRHACRHNSNFKIEWNTRRKTVKTKVSRIIHAYIISLPSYIFIKALNLL